MRQSPSRVDASNTGFTTRGIGIRSPRRHSCYEEFRQRWIEDYDGLAELDWDWRSREDRAAAGRDIDLVSIVDEGSTFTLELPLENG